MTAVVEAESLTKRFGEVSAVTDLSFALEAGTIAGPIGRSKPDRAGSSCNDQFGGGGGNRTRVLQYITRASPGAACCVFLSPGSHAGKLPTGSVAVRCPD